MDPVSIGAAVVPLISAAVAYLRDEAAKKAGDKAAEVVGEQAGTALVKVGPQVLTTLRTWFGKQHDAKAERALAEVEQDPSDEDYQHKLVKETTRLAAADSTFAQELRVLAEQVAIAQGGSIIQTFHNEGSIIGNQGTNAGTVTQQIGAIPYTHERRDTNAE